MFLEVKSKISAFFFGFCFGIFSPLFFHGHGALWGRLSLSNFLFMKFIVK